MRNAWVLAALLLFAVLPGPSGAEATDPIPHVLVAVPDSGINPYHQEFHRPELTDHPCTYIEDFPCNVEKLELSIGDGLSYSQAVSQDRPVWDSLEPGTWYWIPETPFVAVMCEPDNTGGATSDPSESCILDDGTNHGTGTTSSVIRENPDALIAFKQGGAGHQAFLNAGLPVDVFSVSWSHVVPLPLTRDTDGIYVKSSGNDPSSSLMDGWSGNPRAITVGGAYARGLTAGPHEEALATKQPDVVGPFCRSVASADSTTASRSACGTSFAAPTAAGGLSKAISLLREDSGYTGATVNGFVDPLLGITTQDLRDAMNRTATYDASHRSERSIFGVPMAPMVPWLQWGWGWYDAHTAEATAKHLLAIDPAPAKPEAARLYMETVYEARLALYDTGVDQHQPEAVLRFDCDGLTCTFDGTQSSDPDGQPFSYHWDLGDGTTATDAIVEHTYTTGARDVTLTVSDGQLTDATTTEVFTLPEALLDVSTDRSSYGLQDDVVVTATLTERETGDPISGIPIELEAQYQAAGSNGLHQGRTYRAMDEADTGHHETTVITDDDGIATWTIPSDVAEQEEHLNLPTGTEEVAVTSTFDRGGVRLWDKTTYTVSPL